MEMFPTVTVMLSRAARLAVSSATVPVTVVAAGRFDTLTTWVAGKLLTVTDEIDKAGMVATFTVTTFPTVTVAARAPLMTAWLNVTTVGVSVMDR